MTVKFRKLYWVTEELSASGSSVNGVYTSFVDLIEKGLASASSTTRLSLFKLDCPGAPMRTWRSDSCDNLAEDLQEFVESGEFVVEDCRNLEETFAKIGN